MMTRIFWISAGDVEPAFAEFCRKCAPPTAARALSMLEGDAFNCSFAI
jgi:hypothetical protein